MEMDDEPGYELAITCSTGEVASGGGIEQAVTATLRRHRVRHAQISIALVSDTEIARLNEHHLQHQGPTDVLTFDLRGELPAGIVPRQGSDFVTDIDAEIVISVDTATREAAIHGHSVEAELALYAVHGTLHLVGYNDKNEADALRMHRVEDEILCALGLGSVYGVRPG